MSAVSPYRVTPDDLPDLDGKTADALTPLLDSLNVTVQQLVNAVQAIPPTKSMETTFNSSATGTASVDFSPAPIPVVRSVSVDWFQREDRAITAAAFSVSTLLLDSGLVRLSFVGLDASAKYLLRVTLR